LHWRDGEGWLVLSGGGDFSKDETLDIDSQVLSRTISQGPLAILWSATDIEAADRYLDYLRDLGGRTGFLLDITSESPADVQKQLEDVGIIILMDGAQPERLREALPPIRHSLEKAHDNGATIYAQGKTAASFAAWIPGSRGLQPGFSWLEKAILVAPYTDSEPLKTWLQTTLPDGYGIGIGIGSALALSPTGEVEIWGGQAVNILLGKNLTPP
jgi:hypothetical protein